MAVLFLSHASFIPYNESMQVIERHMNQIREEAVRNLQGDAGQSSVARSGDVQQLILVSLALWRATREAVATRHATDRSSKREAAGMLRSSEQAMASVA